MLKALANSPLDVSTTVSGLVVPDPVSLAPPVAAELLQPCAGSPVLLHGHCTLALSPKQIGQKVGPPLGQ